MSTLGLIVFFSLVGGLFSLIGGAALLVYSHRARRFSIHLVTFAAGALLGASFLDILPESLSNSSPGSYTNDQVLAVVLAGILSFFIIERILLRFHSHEDDGHVKSAAPLAYYGDAIHNFLDGVAIAISFLVSNKLGIVTALAVAAHEIPEEIGLFSIFLAASWSKRKIIVFNIAASLLTTLGAVATYLARDVFLQFIPFLLAFTAGNFIYIALSDLVPEIHHQTRKDKGWHVVALLIIGVAAVGAITKIIEQILPGKI